MSALDWYVRRLLAMRPAEVIAHLRKAVYRNGDSFKYRRKDYVIEICNEAYPDPPKKDSIAESYCRATVKEADELMAGKWTLFRDLALDVDSPPLWQKDYLSGKNIFDNRPFKFLNHRKLKGADIKVVWDLNRWSQLVRIAQAAYVTGEECYVETVKRWLEYWVEVNPPFRGWNWTSALESAIRLIQFAWIESLLEDRIDVTIRDAIAIPHVRYTWRHRSSGSSANNHWLGELAGLIVAGCRWKTSANESPGVEELKVLFEREIIAQFAEDGGNKEQAFHYHIFSFEFVIHAYCSLLSVGLQFRPDVLKRIESAASFIVNFQSPDRIWEYGDSDDAVLVPFGESIPSSSQSWCDWLQQENGVGGPAQWLGTSHFSIPKIKNGWLLAEKSGYAVFRDESWFVRVDGSPLGYLSLAAHGHLDAMHVSVWFQSLPLIVDPGTGAYYFDPLVRELLAGETAHNGPVVGGVPLGKRRGVFLWVDHHPNPTVRLGDAHDAVVCSEHRQVVRRRRVLRNPSGWMIEDRVQTPNPSSVAMNWIFAPEVMVDQVDADIFRLRCGEAVLCLRVDRAWEKVSLGSWPVSPSFRVMTTGCVISLVGESNGSRPFVTVLEGPA